LPQRQEVRKAHTMKSYWLKLLLLATFSFWGSGAAKYVHEALEHHGRDASVDDDDGGSLFTSCGFQPQHAPHRKTGFIRSRYPDSACLLHLVRA
jgi:hypothetical protein